MFVKGGVRMLFCTWFDTWLTVWCRRLRPATVASYMSLYRLYLQPFLAEKPLSAVTPEDVQLAIDRALDAGHGRTAELLFDMFRACFRRAVRVRHLDHSPVDAVDSPKFERKTVCALSPDKVNVFVAEARNQPLWPAYALMLYAGLRRGEVIALKWRDVDLTHGVLHVRQSAVAVNGQLVIGPPKSAAGVRSVPLLNPLPQVLRARRLAALHAGAAGADRPVIVSSATNGYITPSGLQSGLRRVQRREPALAGVTLHALRHTYATALQEQGLNIKSLQYVLGHSSSCLTLDTYCKARYNSVAADFVRCGLAL